MISSRSVWAQSSRRIRNAVGAVIIVGAALLFSIECIKGNPSGLLTSVIWALTLPVMFAVSILFLSIGRTAMRQEQITWYKQPNFFRGIGLVLQASGLLILIFALTLFVPANRPVPPLLLFFVDAAYLFLLFTCVMQSIVPDPALYKNRAKRVQDQPLH